MRNYVIVALVGVVLITVWINQKQQREIDQLQSMMLRVTQAARYNAARIDTLEPPAPVYIDTVITPSVKAWIIDGGLFLADSGQSALTINGSDSTTLNYVMITNNHTFVGPIHDYRRFVLDAIGQDAKRIGDRLGEK